MRPAERLALKRELLVLQARAQRLQLRWAWRDVRAAARPRPSWLLAGLLAALALRWIGVRRALGAWRMWRMAR